MKRLKKTTWNTYKSNDIWNFQVRQEKRGWWTRVIRRHDTMVTAAMPIPDSVGEARFAAAKER